MKMKKRMLQLVLLLFFAVLGLACYPDQKAYAAGPVQVVAVAYSDESIVILNNGNTKIYYANELDAGRGNWDVINVSASDVFTIIDVSWMSANTENILKFKGNNNQTITRAIIKRRPQRLEVSINYSTFSGGGSLASLLNIRSTEGSGDKPITFDDLQWKKGSDGEWMSTSLLTQKLLESYIQRGTLLYFRTAPLNDVAKVVKTSTSADLTSTFRTGVGHLAYIPVISSDIKPPYNDLTYSVFPDGTQGRRAGSEVRLKINKQNPTAVTKVDGSEFTMDINYGQEYRISYDNGVTYSGWTQVTDRIIDPLKLKNMIGAGPTGPDGCTRPFPEMMIDVREYATAKAVASKITTTSLLQQRTITGTAIEGIPTVADDGIYVSYSGNKNLIVNIPSASEDVPYEYTIVKKDNVLDLEHASWTQITKNMNVKIVSTKAPDGSMIYFRMKEIKYKAATEMKAAVAYQMASTYATFKVNYPSLPSTPKNTYVYTKTYSGDITIPITLNVIGKKPYEIDVKAVKLGTKDLVFTDMVSPNPAIINTNNEYIMTITLTGTELAKMANCTARTISIYYANGTVDRASSKLTIKNPTAAGLLTINPVAGPSVGTTTVEVLNTIPSTNKLVYEITAAEVTGKNIEDKVVGTMATLDPSINTAGQVDKYLTIYEVIDTDPSTTTDAMNIVRYRSVKITSGMIATAP